MYMAWPLGGSAVYRLGVPEQALGGIPQVLVEDKPSELLWKSELS